MSGRDDKAQRYIALLDDARTNASWSELPELTRKVKKHAPQRKCLIQTATLEHAIVATLINKANRGSELKPSSISSQVTDLKKEEETSKGASPDAIQAQAACLWAYLAVSERDGLQEPQLVPSTAIATSSDASKWTDICRVKASYFTGMILKQRNRTQESETSFRSILPWLEANASAVAGSAQLAYWSEQILAEIAMSPHSEHNNGAATVDFRRWAVLTTNAAGSSSQAFGNPVPQISRSQVWHLYYHQVSQQLRAPPQENSVIGRRTLVTELRRVEAAYEKDLMRATKFPRADQSNAAMERWVEQVTSNWEIICGSDWTEDDIGEGGRCDLTRNVLDVLYRAANKTFHSTIILRKLFQVHKALTEFDLAYRALDSYLELTERERARSKKAGELHNQDSDESVLCTIAEGIVGLCSFGRSQEAERAEALCQKLEALLTETDPSAIAFEAPHIEVNGVEDIDTDAPKLSARVREVVHRALGIGKAHWARWTPFNENRTVLQTEAIRHLKIAAEQPLEISQKWDSCFALALLLAQTRDVDAAVDCVKETLAESASPESTNYLSQRKLLPLWHLLSLLLSSREEFDTANQACLAAFEQFQSPQALFGSKRSSRDVEKESGTSGLVDDMENAEKERLLEVRLTETALTDLINGPEEAVNASNDLLVLYSRMFGKPATMADVRPAEKSLLAPQSAAGTLKSSKGSIFRRSRHMDAEATNEKGTHHVASTISSSRPTTRATQAPTIQVTDEDAPSPHKHRLFRHSHEHTRKGRTSTDTHSSLSSKLRPSSRDRKPLPSTIPSSNQSFETGLEDPAPSTGTTEPARPQLDTIYSAEAVTQQDPPTNSDVNNSPAAKHTLPQVEHKLADHESMPGAAHHNQQPPEQDIRLPTVSLTTTAATAPIPRFPHASSQKYALTVLVKLWLTIAQLYRRATMFEDSREATDEAAKAALKIEALVASTIESSARAFADPGWGSGGKSSDECWADVYCERGELLLAIANARRETIPHQTASTTTTAPTPANSEHDESVREAVEMLEQCLMYKQTHLRGGVVLSNLLLDYYERKIDLTRRSDDDETTLRKLGVTLPTAEGAAAAAHSNNPSATTLPARPRRAETSLTAAINGSMPSPDLSPTGGTSVNRPSSSSSSTHQTPSGGATTDEDHLKKTPENLNRLAARDRAYGLLSGLTKSGEGWDDSEAWFALARAHELGGETERAKDILWWVVRLEDSRPVRGWGCVNPGGRYVL